MNILIVGYGNIGKHIYEEFKSLKPDIFDPKLPEYNQKQNKYYDFAFICVPTDSLPDGSCDTSIVEQAVSETEAGIIVVKSTIPPGTTARIIGATNKKIVFSPEHYGVTQHCKADPGFVILGGEKDLTSKVAEAYGKVKNGYYKIRFTDATTAELSKYMLNSFLALKVTFCNEFADLAKKFGVSYPELRELFVLDERVGASHTFVYEDKPYYDSHCFNKDVPALVKFADGAAPLISCADKINLEKKANSRAKAAGINTHEKMPKRFCLGNPPESLQNEIFRIRKENLLRNRTELWERSRQTDFKYYCSLCLIIRDESEYLEEWLRWHIGQGVEHFYIYDHGSKYPVAEFVRSLDAEIASKVTVSDWSGSHENAQPNAYNDCLNRFRGESKWIGFIDTDEQVCVKNDQSLPEFLKNYEEYAGVFAVWVTYGASGQKNKSNLPLRQRFQKRSTANSWAERVGKVFVQPLFMKEMYIHNGRPEEGFDIVGEAKDFVPEYQLAKDNPSTELICVDHFYTKSYEEWIEKLKRGSCHAHYARKYEEFFKCNPDMEYCRENINIVQKYEVSQKEGIAY